MNKKLNKGKTKKFVSMPMVNPNAAGIDVGDTLFSVAVPEGQRYNSGERFWSFYL